MATTEPITETHVTLRLSERAHTRLAQQAAKSGRDISAAVSELIEHAVARPSIDEIMAPVRKQVVESGMSGDELDDFLRGELEAHRREKKAKAS